MGREDTWEVGIIIYDDSVQRLRERKQEDGAFTQSTIIHNVPTKYSTLCQAWRLQL